MRTRLFFPILTAVCLVLPLLGCQHDPNAGISAEEAKKAAQSLHPKPPPLPPGVSPGDAGKPVMVSVPFEGPPPPAKPKK